MTSNLLRRAGAAFVLAAILVLCLSTAAQAVRNHAPIANPDSYSLQEDALFSVGKANGVLRNDRDREGNRLMAKLVRATDHGTIVLGKDGSFMYDPADDYNGTDSFGYRACEVERPRVCSTSVPVKLTVAGVNDPPVAGDDSYLAKKNRSKTVSAPGVLANDADVDGDALHVAGYTQPRGGRVTLFPGGSLRFVPDKNFLGRTYFRYWAADEGGLKDEAVVRIRVRS